MEDSREDDIEDNFYCYYVGSQKNMDNEASWQKFYATDAGTTGTVGAILDSLIVDIYKNNEYGKQTERDDASEEGLELEPEETQAPSGLANADASNLQRSDLETAAEAALGE